MLKCLWAIALTVWIAVGVAQIASLAPTPTGHAPSKQQSQTSTDQPNNENHPSFLSPFFASIDNFITTYRDEIVAISTAVLTIITAILVYVARSQYLTTQQQLRAYVWTKATELHGLQVGVSPLVKLEIRNSGVTPAHDVTVMAGCLVYPYPLPIGTKFPIVNTSNTTQMVLNPGADPPFIFIAHTYVK